MEQYIGVKIIHAEPQMKNAEDGYKVVYLDAYESWSPKTVFEEAYRKTDGLTLGLATEAMKKNFRVSRLGWNGKNMWVRLVIPGGDNLEFDMGYENLPYFELKTADNKLVPWVPSQIDLLAEDYQIVS